MKAYNNEALENSFLSREARKLKEQGFISKEQYNAASAVVPVLQVHHNYLVRFGFFLLGCLLFSAITGALSMALMPVFGSGEFYKIILFLYAGIGFFGAEYLCRQNYYRHGLDDAFVLSAQFVFAGAVGATGQSPLLGLLALTSGSIFCCLRYVNTLAALIAACGLTGFVGNLIIEHKILDMWFLPFVMLFLAAALYMTVKYFDKSPKSLYYGSALHWVYAFSLLLGYFSVNYLVVRELSQELMNVVVPVGSDIPFAFLFYGFTFGIPAFYIVFSLLKKDRTMLYIGFLTLAFAFFTIRYYYQLMPIEIALIAGGVILFGLAYYFMQLLKGRTEGVTFEKELGTDSDSLLNAQALIVNSALGLKGNPADDQKMPFGGGGYSGGGAGEGY